jgi:threonine dehydrogenase-like Zn-dependent dehydrogenase
MLALVKTAARPGLELRDVPLPTIGINDILIRVHKTGICGTDLHIESWDPWAARTIEPPLVVGHEFVGEIVDVGSNVADFHPGDLVSGEGTWCAASAGTAWPGGVTCAPTRSASASGAMGRSPSTWRCR